MRQGAGAVVLVLAVVVAVGGCGRRGLGGVGREVVTPLLQQEAESLKRDNEKLDPVLRVKATWAIAGIDVTERANDPDRPWAGTIRFKITSETKDTDNAVVVDQFDRRFDYVYDANLKHWVFQLTPSPAP